MNLGDLYHFVRFSDGALREMPLDACLAHLEAAEPHIRSRMCMVTMRVVAVRDGEEPCAETLRPEAPVDSAVVLCLHRFELRGFMPGPLDPCGLCGLTRAGAHSKPRPELQTLDEEARDGR